MYFVMNRLPLEIIREHIIPYTYSPQNDQLLDDIKSFYIVRNLLLNIYYYRWKEAFNYEKNADLNWLDNDISRFYNDDNAIMFGYTDNCIKKFKRCYMFKDKEVNFIIKNVNNIMRNCKNVKSAINIQLGLLDKEERQKLLSFCLVLE